MNGFVYCWTDHVNQKLYVGSHKGTPDDGYVCSSKLVKQEIKKRPQDWSRQIIAEGDIFEIRALEGKILKAVDARNNPDYYNKHNHDMRYYITGPFSEEHKRKIQESRKKNGFKLSEEHKRKLNEGRRRSKNSSEHNAALSKALTGRKHSEETKKKLSAAKIGKPSWNKGISSSKETRERLSNTLKNQPLVECPHCKLNSRSIANMKRYHFDNCRNKP